MRAVNSVKRICLVCLHLAAAAINIPLITHLWASHLITKEVSESFSKKYHLRCSSVSAKIVGSVSKEGSSRHGGGGWDNQS